MCVCLHRDKTTIICKSSNNDFSSTLLSEKARLQAEAKAAEEARRKAEAEAAAEARRKRELEREAARLALQKVKWTHYLTEPNATNLLLSSQM